MSITFSKQEKAHQPFMHGYNANAIKNWSPETDSYAKYFRSRVSLAKRIPPFAPTQANPNLHPGPKVMNLSADYDKTDTIYKYNDSYCSNLLKFWQYTDFYGAWHGLPLENSDANEPVYGVLNLPNPAYTDAAHRNGVLSLGCWFWPREEETFSDLVGQNSDGSFPIADKMIEMANYFGFDGYFINQEAPISGEDASKLLEMMKYFKAKAPENFYLQWYDTILVDGDLRYQNQFNSKNAPWLIDEDGNKVIDSMFINYAFNDDRMKDSEAYAKSLGLDPYEALFPGTENDKYGFNPPYDTRLIFPENEQPRASWGLFGTDFVWNRYVNKLDANDQGEVYRRERHYWSGPLENPTDPIGRTLYKPYKDPFHEVDRENYRKWDGVAHYIPARSVIGSYPFVTRFNTGHGKAFFLNGEMSHQQEWNNASIQDLLPSWQWWIQSYDKNEQPLYTRTPVSELPLQPSYDYHTAYNGGSSLKISGKLEPEVSTELRLFKTKLSVTSNVELSLTFKEKKINSANHMYIGLIFEDAPTDFIWLPVDTSKNNDWSTQTFSLAEFVGKTVATIGLKFESSEETDYEMYIGELALTNGKTPVPPTPTKFKVDQAHVDGDLAELFLSWDFNKDNVWYYEVFHCMEGGQKQLVGRIYDEVYYIKEFKKLENVNQSNLELIAVGFDGTNGSAAKTVLTWPN